MPGTCKNKQEYIDDNFTFIENSDGTVSLFDDNMLPVTSHQTKPCCELLGYTFDVEEQKCMWGATGTNELFKVILNPEGNSSTLFEVEPNEECNLEVSFDYLFLFKCDELITAKANANGVISTFDAIGSTLTTQIQNQITVDNLEAEISTLTNQVQFYNDLISSTIQPPFVIECMGSGIASPSVATISNPSIYYGGNLPSYSFPATPINNYCLTTDGVNQWKTILDDKDNSDLAANIISSLPTPSSYDKWFNSTGSDISMYGCDEVNALVALNTAITPLIETTCNYNVFDRKKSNEDFQINKIALQTAKANLTAKENERDTLLLTVVSPNPNVSTTIDCTEYINMFETFDTSFTVEILSGTALTTVYEEDLITIGTGNLYNYIDSTSGKTGILISGDTRLMPTLEETDLFDLTADLCSQIRDTLVTDLFDQYLTNNPFPATQPEQIEIFKKLTEWYQSPWLQYKTVIKDKNVISLLENQKINISVSINDTCTNFSILVDRIKMNKVCTKTDNVKEFISEPPKFELTRTPDNQKSWLANTTRDSRYTNLKYRGTEYNTNHHKLVVNTKEVDLNLSPSRAVEQDVWCYVSDNNCILEGCMSSGETYSAFTCPSGYGLDIDGNSCTKLTTTGVTTSAVTYTIGAGLGLTRPVHYLSRGTIFIEDITNKSWPIYWTGTTKDSWVGPYYNSDYLVDYSGNYLNHTGFGSNTFTDGSIQYASPNAFSGIKSEYGKSNSSIYGSKLNPNILWGGTDGPVTGTPYVNITNTNKAGRLLNASIWSTGLTPTNEWIGVSYCFELTETKVYRLGFAGDDDVRIKVNGKYIFNSAKTPSHDIKIHKNFSSSYSRTAQSYLVVGVSLPAGKNIIEVEGYNAILGVSGFVLEVYDATEAQLKNMRYETELNSVRVFSTVDRIGQTFDLGEKSANSCPTGYAYDNCNPGSTSCLLIERTFRKTQQLDEYCPCPTYPLITKDYSGTTIELPLTASTGNTSSVTRVVATSRIETRFPPSSSIASVALNADPYDGVNGLDTMFYIDNLSTPYPWTLVPNGTYSVISNDNIFLSESTLDGNGNGKRGLMYYDGLSSINTTVNSLGQGLNYNLTQLASDIEMLFFSMENTTITVEPIAEIAYDGADLGIRLQFKITYFGDEATINGLNQIFKILVIPHTTLSFSNDIEAIVPNGTYGLSPSPGYSWGPISVPVPFTCNDITTLVSNYNTTTTLKDVDVIKGRSAYALGTETTTTFNGFWITEENDGTIGLYSVNYSAGTPHNYQNISNELDLDCCKVIDDAFTAYTETFKQGVDTYPSISWDGNKNKCVYRKCGDSGCIDLDDVLTTELSAIDTVKEFAATLSSELIDVKNRKTLSGYPTLRMLYDRYNTRSEEFCDNTSSKYDYFDMDKFGQTVGDYWIDLIEQVVPATTIWGSTYTYKNTVFDQQKFDYRNSNMYFCLDIPNPPVPGFVLAKNETKSCSCPTTPLLYAPTPALEKCQKKETISVLGVAGGTVISATRNPAYSTGGALFFNDISGEVFPLKSFPSSSNVTDGNNNVIPHAFQVKNKIGVTPLTNNELWCSAGDTTAITSGPNTGFYRGRLNNTGVWAYSAGTTTQVGKDIWVGFVDCINILVSKKYCIGIAADDQMKFSINGKQIFEWEDTNNGTTHQYWRVFEITLDSGLNSIRMEGLDESSSPKASFGAEIYESDITSLSNMTTVAELAAVTIFSTSNLVSTPTVATTVTTTAGVSSAYYCPTGYVLTNCNSGALECTKFNEVGIVCNTNNGFALPVTNDTLNIEPFYYDINNAVVDGIASSAAIVTPVEVPPSSIYIALASATSNQPFSSSGQVTGGLRELEYYDGTKVTLNQAPGRTLTQLADEISADFLLKNPSGDVELVLTPKPKITSDGLGNLTLDLDFEISYNVVAPGGDPTLVSASNLIKSIYFKNGTIISTNSLDLEKNFNVRYEFPNSASGGSNWVVNAATAGGPTSGVSRNYTTNVIIQELPKPIEPNPDGTVNLSTVQPSIKTCDGVYILDRNCDSQFLGTVKEMDNLGNITTI